MKAEEIARNISPCPCCTGDYSGVVKAIHEYGQAVRDRDAEICQMDANGPQCAAAINREPLP